MIIVSGDTYSIVDFKSSNGVFVNDRQIEHVMLHDGDIIRMGDQVFNFTIEDLSSSVPDSDSPLSVSPGGGATFHTMIDLERSLNQDTMSMLEKPKKTKKIDAFDKLVILFQVSKVINSVHDTKDVLNKVIVSEVNSAMPYLRRTYFHLYQ